MDHQIIIIFSKLMFSWPYFKYCRFAQPDAWRSATRRLPLPKPGSEALIAAGAMAIGQTRQRVAAVVEITDAAAREPCVQRTVPTSGATSMAHFYLNIRDGEELIRDPEAYVFDSAAEAREAAVQSVRDLIRANPEDFEFDHKQIEIADATGHAISVVNLYDVAPHLSH
jgi:hypothetical protein